MFKLTAIVCFLSMGSMNLDLCMKAELPLTFETQEKCFEAAEQFVRYTNQDLIDRNIAMRLTCERTNYQDVTFFRLPI